MHNISDTSQGWSFYGGTPGRGIKGLPWAPGLLACEIFRWKKMMQDQPWRGQDGTETRIVDIRKVYCGLLTQHPGVFEPIQNILLLSYKLASLTGDRPTQIVVSRQWLHCWPG